MSTHRQGPFPRALWAAVRARWTNPRTIQSNIASQAQIGQAAVSIALATLKEHLDYDLSHRSLAHYYIENYPGPKGEASYWSSAEHPSNVAKRLTKLGFVVSGDPAAAVLAPWRTPTHTIAYAQQRPTDDEMLDSTYVEEPVHGEANLVLITSPADQALLTQTSTEDNIRLAHPLQVAWDLHQLQGTDRAEAADRLLSLDPQQQLAEPGRIR